MNIELDDSLKITNERLGNICRYRQPDCCKYIIFFEKKGDFFCVKNVPELREILENAEMTATNDNCEGLIDETGSQPQGTSD